AGGAHRTRLRIESDRSRVARECSGVARVGAGHRRCDPRVSRSVRTTRGRRRAVTRAWVSGVLLLLSGCAYYNGVYNAERASRSGDRQWARGEYLTEADSYRVAAIHAETVLARFEKSRWRAQALYLAARSAALSNDCATARRRLNEYLVLPDQPAERVDRATVAKALCLIEEGKSQSADSLLRPLLGHPDAAVRLPAALFSARLAVAAGDPIRAQQLLATIPGSAAVWEN